MDLKIYIYFFKLILNCKMQYGFKRFMDQFPSKDITGSFIVKKILSFHYKKKDFKYCYSVDLNTGSYV